MIGDVNGASEATGGVNGASEATGGVNGATGEVSAAVGMRDAVTVNLQQSA